MKNSYGEQIINSLLETLGLRSSLPQELTVLKIILEHSCQKIQDPLTEFITINIYA